MPTLSAAALVAAWEDGMDEPAVDRAPTLLSSLGLVEPESDPAAMTVGTCDLLLFDLRRALFGPDLELVGNCPTCGEGVELVVPTAEVVPTPPAHRVSHVELEDSGLRVACRLPTNGDLRELGTLGSEATVVDLLERCVEKVEGDNAALPASEWPPATAERLAAALAARDPGADVSIEIECPCGATWSQLIDIRSILWTEVTRWVQARLTEVHQLASAYGWSERDVLAMSPYRRRFYLDSIAG
jgi:hypothetical protein